MTTPRRGLVLGGGGVLGAAWMVGALRALEDELGVDLRTFESLVGTSAGSVLASLLGAGIASRTSSPPARHAVATQPLAGFALDHEDAAGGDRPARPRPASARTRLLVRNARHLRQLPPTAVLSAFLPEGRGRLDSVGALISHVVPQGWVRRPGLRVVALDYDTGAAGAVRRAGGARRDLPTAVMASCAIPGWYQPVRIGDHRFIDGGAWSSTNVDLMAGPVSTRSSCLAPTVSLRRRPRRAS